MASENIDDGNPGADRITFELEHLGVDPSGQLLVSGRWFGVRGRRFVRPTLTLKVRSDGSQRRALADLEHKPWAAEDGELWIAAFRIPVALDQAEQLELSVAPDVAVELTQSQARARGRRARTSQAPEARAPRIRTDPVPARPSASDREQEIERLRIRLTEAERAKDREYAKRQAADRTLEDERSEALRLRSEVAKLRADLDLAAMARTQLDATAAELDTTRVQARESAERLQNATHALDEHRAEVERLRTRVTASEATVERLSQARETEERHAAEEAEARRRVRKEESRRRPRDEDARSGVREQETRRQPRGDETATLPVQRADPADRGSVGQEPTESHPAGTARRGRSSAPNRADALYVRPERPLNPSLRSRRWLGRLMTLIVMAAVVAAIVLVIHSQVHSLP
jgi:hypothetical protein